MRRAILGRMTEPTESISREDAARIEAFLHGDRETSALFQEWVGIVVRHRAWRLDREEDLTQETLLKLFVVFSRGGFAGRSTLKTFVQRVAKYTCLDAVRRSRRAEIVSFEENGEPDPVADDSPERELDARETSRLCYAVLDHLPAPCRELLQRVLADDSSYEELAQELDVAVGTVKSRVARCRGRAQELRRKLLRTPRLWKGGSER